MLASELIKKLQELQEQFGDLEVKVDVPYFGEREQQDIDYLYLGADNEETEYWFSIVY